MIHFTVGDALFALVVLSFLGWLLDRVFFE